MSNHLNQDFEYFARKLRMSMREKTKMKRTNIALGQELFISPKDLMFAKHP